MPSPNPCLPECNSVPVISQIPGSQGPQGPTGATGSTGATGPAGLGINWRGAWSGVVSYAVNDGVYIGGSAFVALLPNLNSAPDSGPPPASNATWSLMASVGSNGILSTYSAYAAGTPYTFVDTNMDLMAFGTTSPTMTLGPAGTYIIFARARFDSILADITTASTTITAQLQNTAKGVIPNSTRAAILYLTQGNVQTYTYAEITLPLTVYTSAVAGDTVSVYAQLSALPNGNSGTTHCIQCSEADLFAIQIA